VSTASRSAAFAGTAGSSRAMWPKMDRRWRLRYWKWRNYTMPAFNSVRFGWACRPRVARPVQTSSTLKGHCGLLTSSLRHVIRHWQHYHATEKGLRNCGLTADRTFQLRTSSARVGFQQANHVSAPAAYALQSSPLSFWYQLRHSMQTDAVYCVFSNEY